MKQTVHEHIARTPALPNIARASDTKSTGDARWAKVSWVAAVGFTFVFSFVGLLWLQFSASPEITMREAVHLAPAAHSGGQSVRATDASVPAAAEVLRSQLSEETPGAPTF